MLFSHTRNDNDIWHHVNLLNYVKYVKRISELTLPSIRLRIETRSEKEGLLVGSLSQHWSIKA